MKTIIITSTGRSGTTFLMFLYSYLGFYTGFNKNNFSKYIYQHCNAGLEREKESIYKYEVVKSPYLLNKMHELNHNQISWVIIPLRNFKEAAKSREFYGNKEGGLIGGATNWKEQVAIFEKFITKYLEDMVKFDIPTIFLDFNKMTKNPEYLFHKIKKTLKKEVTYDYFLECYQKASDHQKQRTEYQSPLTERYESESS